MAMFFLGFMLFFNRLFRYKNFVGNLEIYDKNIDNIDFYDYSTKQNFHVDVDEINNIKEEIIPTLAFITKRSISDITRELDRPLNARDYVLDR